jgi:molybdopterin/thiamine biosynthesis adenylyltransferase
MKRTTLSLPEPIWAELISWLAEHDEVAAVLTAHVINDDGGMTLLGRTLHRAPGEAYLERRRDGLSLRSSGWLPAVRRSRQAGTMALFVHTHPQGNAVFSDHDDTVDDALWPAFVEHSGAPLYGSLVIAGTSHRPAVAGRTRAAHGPSRSIDSVRIVGDRLTVHTLGVDGPHEAAFDRQLRALGGTGQAILGQLKVGVVGAGGTGSPVTEQLLRLGVGSVVIIDDDTVTASTVARGYGSGLADIDRPKVEVLQALADRIGLGTVVHAVFGNIRERRVVHTLRHCDVVFCCADGHAARLVLNRWAYRHLAPVIDVAVLVSSTDDTVAGVDGRITWLAPGAACLLCRGRIDPAMAYAEQLSPEERRRLAEQGYAPELDEPQPSVVTFTTLMAGLAVTELLNRMFGLADATPTEILLRLHDRKTSLNRRAPRPGCFCSTPSTWGLGLQEPYLDLTWADQSPS